LSEWVLLMHKPLAPVEYQFDINGALYLAKRTFHLLQKADILICYEQPSHDVGVGSKPAQGPHTM
ncbi:MAG TPA: hypothetical protein VEZ90_14410, partial [Blastocatellia bacterium]|nr:hypothetical protein [Blastocatellia bacterium]